MAIIGQAFSLAQLIEKTADELRSLKKRPHPNAVMRFTGCELELAVTLTAEAGGEIKFWLVGASTKAKGETVSRIKLNFGPIPVDKKTGKSRNDFGVLVAELPRGRKLPGRVDPRV